MVTVFRILTAKPFHKVGAASMNERPARVQFLRYYPSKGKTDTVVRAAKVIVAGRATEIRSGRKEARRQMMKNLKCEERYLECDPKPDG